jgi:hypothetical protein
MTKCKFVIRASFGFRHSSFVIFISMTLNLKTLTESILSTVFNLGDDIVKNVTYVRPASLARETGLSAANEISVAAKAVITTLPGGAATFEPSRKDTLLIRAADLISITTPAAGDYILETLTGLRRDVTFARLDPTGQVWSFHTVRSLHEDFGDLNPHGSSEDGGDLAAATAIEERGALYE